MPLLAARPLASLSSGLLARKGQARPAMRAQNPVAFADVAPADDLGWNDMGDMAPPMRPATPLSAPVATTEPAVPSVLVERASLQRAVEQAAPMVEPGPAIAAGQAGQRAAFTLRLDPHRHLRLRLASASTNRSSQQLMIQALDMLLAGLPEVEVLAAQLPATGGAA